jgi:hypothetical protein
VKKKLFIFVLMAVVLVMAAGCAPGAATQIDIPSVSLKISVPGPNPQVNTEDANGHVAGILLGLWHGFISPVTLVLSFPNPDFQIYEVHNDGSPYNLGFLLGVAIVFIVLGVFVGSRRHR